MHASINLVAGMAIGGAIGLAAMAAFLEWRASAIDRLHQRMGYQPHPTQQAGEVIRYGRYRFIVESVCAQGWRTGERMVRRVPIQMSFRDDAPELTLAEHMDVAYDILLGDLRDLGRVCRSFWCGPAPHPDAVAIWGAEGGKVQP